MNNVFEIDNNAYGFIPNVGDSRFIFQLSLML